MAAGKKELDLALRLTDGMTDKWKPSQYHDDYRESLLDFIEKKIAGGDVADDVKQPDHDKDDLGDKVLDLAAYLERSIKKPVVAAAAPSKGVAEKKKTAEKDADKKTATKRGRRSA